MSESNICVRCGDKYEPYHVFFQDEFGEVVEYQRTKSEWDLHQDGNDGLCKPCRMAVTDYGAYLTESEREELEPKHDV